MFLGLMVVLAVVTSTSWLRGSSAGDCARRKLDQKLAAVLLLALLVQIVLGAVQRHFGTVLLHHLFFAAVVAILAIISGTRAWGYYPAEPNLRRFGGALLYVTTLQLVIGFGALIATLPFEAKQNPSTAFEVWIPTAHQAIGAILVANVVALLMWLFRSHDPLDSETAVVRKG
jgi:cytochrome c oxidase assembly protein subunit 15